MKKKTTRLTALILSVLMLIGTLSGCAGKKTPGEQSKEDGKISISFYAWDRSMFKQFTPWLEEKFPEIEFTFIQSYNTMEYYKDLMARGEEMPDIITCRRFSLNDAASLSTYLMDLSNTEVAGTFYTSYLNVNKEPGGAIRWLPMCAEVDCTMANKDLFDQYNIPLPTNYAEFVAAIEAFEAVGIKGYQTDWYYDYSCLETMQGCAIPELMSLEGTQWRRSYESESEGNPVGLDTVVWPKVFEKYEQFLKDVHFEPGDEELKFSKVTEPYRNGQIAMIRNTAALADNITLEDGTNSVILPYFGETSEDNWLLTYPMCQLAVSKKVEKDEAKWILTARNAIYRGEYTGEEVRRFMEWMVNVKEDGSNPIRHRNLMPVTSGLEYTVTETERGKFRLESVTVGGQPLDDNGTYTMLLVGADTFMEHESFCNCPMPEDLKSKRQAYLASDFSSQECMQEALEKTKQFLEPTEYVTILPSK